MIPDEAVEAAARAMAPAMWGPRVWTFMAHGETPTAARERVQRQSLDDARAALEAAAPYMLAGLRELVEDMERQPRTELSTVPGIAAIIRATLGDLP